MRTEAEELLPRAVAGDEAALTALLEAEHGALHAWVKARIGRKYQSTFSADDVLQITYLEAFMTIRRFRPESDGGFIRWLQTIAEHNIRDAIKELNRKRRPRPALRRDHLRDDHSYVSLLALLPGSQTTPSQGAFRGEVRCLLDDAIAQLPPDYAHVVREFDLAGRDAAEVAREMGRSIGAVYMLRVRGHRWLAEILGESGDYFGRSA